MVTILWFSFALERRPVSALHQAASHITLHCILYCIQWLGQCESLISSEHHSVDSPNWVNQRWSTESLSRERARSFTVPAVLQPSAQTIANEQAKARGHYDGSLWLKRRSLLIARRWRCISCCLFFGSDISLRNSPPLGAQSKRNGLVKMCGRCLHVLNPSAVESRKACGSLASCPLLCILMDCVEACSCVFEQHAIQYSIPFSLGLISPLQHEILHQNFTHIFIF